MSQSRNTKHVSHSVSETVILLPGALAEWLADHPVMLSSVLPLVLQALGNPDLSVSSVSTLKKICRECKYDLPPYATNIVAVSQVHVHISALLIFYTLLPFLPVESKLFIYFLLLTAECCRLL